ncbi:uncharacterized protein [Macaca fascicularis]|uniref:uncharacterized protein n=1 Tax=Macaca fascicularis TaxID=9541 RepID=UPI003D157F72
MAAAHASGAREAEGPRARPAPPRAVFFHLSSPRLSRTPRSTPPDPHSPRRRLHRTQDRSSPAPHFRPHSLKPGPEPLLLAPRPRPHPPQPQRPLAAVALFRACLRCLPEPGPARPPHRCPCPLAAPGHSLARTAALAAAGDWKWRPGAVAPGRAGPRVWGLKPLSPGCFPPTRVRNPRAPPLALLASPVGNPHTGHTLHLRCSQHASSKRATGLSRPCHLPTPSPPFWPAPSSLWQGPLYRDPRPGPSPHSSPWVALARRAAGTFRGRAAASLPCPQASPSSRGFLCLVAGFRPLDLFLRPLLNVFSCPCPPTPRPGLFPHPTAP